MLRLLHLVLKLWDTLNVLDYPIAWTQVGVCLPNQSFLHRLLPFPGAVPSYWESSQTFSTKAMLCAGLFQNFKPFPFLNHYTILLLRLYIYIITNTMQQKEALARDLILISPRPLPVHPPLPKCKSKEK